MSESSEMPWVLGAIFPRYVPLAPKLCVFILVTLLKISENQPHYSHTIRECDPLQWHISTDLSLGSAHPLPPLGQHERPH